MTPPPRLVAWKVGRSWTKYHLTREDGRTRCGLAVPETRHLTTPTWEQAQNVQLVNVCVTCV